MRYRSSHLTLSKKANKHISVFVKGKSPLAGLASCSSAPIFPVCVGLLWGCTLLSSHTASMAPWRAFSLVNSLNSPQRARRQKDRGRGRKAESFLFYLLSCLSLPLFLSSHFSCLTSLQGLFAFYLLMRCILSFSVAPLPCPLGFC